MRISALLSAEFLQFGKVLSGVEMSEFNLMDYAPIAVMFLFATGFGVSQLLVTQLIGPKKRTATKLMPYECGKDPVGSAHDRYSIKFYTVAVIFLLFDLEVLFIVPFAVAFRSLLRDQAGSDVAFGTIAFVEILGFLATLVVGYIYVWKKGTFDWSLQARAEAKAEVKEMARKNRELKRAA
jgi:NADH-quinone oxidoreductase subunit A